jgi:hypothetical protein
MGKSGFVPGVQQKVTEATAEFVESRLRSTALVS